MGDACGGMMGVEAGEESRLCAVRLTAVYSGNHGNQCQLLPQQNQHIRSELSGADMSTIPRG